MRASQTSKSPRVIACALIATSLCVFVPYKLARDSEVLEETEQPTYLTCAGAPVRKTGGSWWPGKTGAYKDLRSDEKLVRQYVAKCTTQEQIENKGTLGIAIPAGGVELLSNSLAAVTTLRKTLGSTLPIEVIYNGPEEYDKSLISQLEALPNVTCLDARKTEHPRHHPAVKLKGLGFGFKAFVLAYATSFDRVLLLDADNFPLRNPDSLFTAGSEEHGDVFRRHGAVFWPDFGQKQGSKSILLARHLDIKPEAYTTFNLSVPWDGPGEPFQFTESGQILFDRVRHADVLEWLWFLNSHQQLVSEWMWGDKDTFRLAFALAGKEENFWQDPPFRHTGMVHHDLDGNLQFLHRTYLGKFQPSAKEPWREMNFVTNVLSPQQAVVYSEAYGFFPHQVTTDFEKHCCQGQSSRDNAQPECDLKFCKAPGKPLPVLAVAAENLDHGVRATLKQLDDLFGTIKANYTARSS